MRSTRRASGIRVATWSAATLAVALATLSGLPAQASQAGRTPVAARPGAAATGRGSAASPRPATHRPDQQGHGRAGLAVGYRRQRPGQPGGRRLAGGQQRDRHPVRCRDLRARVQHALLAAGDQRRRRGSGHRDRGAAAERRLPRRPQAAREPGQRQPAERLLRHQHEEVLRLHEPDRQGDRAEVRGPVVVADRLQPAAAAGPARPARRERRRRRGRGMGERPPAGHPGHGHRRLHAVRLRHHPAAAARDEHRGHRDPAERPEQDVHARRRGLEPDPAGQQHRHPVPGPAAGGRAARRRQRARDRAQRARPDQLGR